jgi:hypothetical protein
MRIASKDSNPTSIKINRGDQKSETSKERERGNAQTASSLVWKGADYPNIEPGKYTVRGASYQGPDWIKKWQRWSMRVEFALVHEAESVSVFFNMGSDRNGVSFGANSRYYKAWTLANGARPTRGQNMSPDVFLQGQFFEVTITHSSTDESGNQISEDARYSKITEIHSVHWV